MVLFEERDFYFIKKKAQVTAMELEREGKRPQELRREENDFGKRKRDNISVYLTWAFRFFICQGENGRGVGPNKKKITKAKFFFTP